MQVNEFLSPNDISIDVRAPDKTALLRGLAQIISRSAPVSAEAVASSLMERERLGTTGTGQGVALPHARMSQLQRPAAHFAKLGRSIDYGSVDDLPVDLVFLILLPEGAGPTSLHVLACAARKLRHQEVQARLRKASDLTSLYAALVA